MNPVLAELWPYFVLIFVGFLPNEIWRLFGLGPGGSLDSLAFHQLLHGYALPLAPRGGLPGGSRRANRR